MKEERDKSLEMNIKIIGMSIIMIFFLSHAHTEVTVGLKKPNKMSII